MSIGDLSAILAIVFLHLLIIYAVSWAFIREYFIAFALERTGLDADARIIERHQDVRRNVLFYVTYQFTAVTKREYTKEQRIKGRNYDVLREDKEVAIRYLRNNPNISRLAGNSEDKTVYTNARNFCIVMLIVLPYSIPIFLLIFYIGKSLLLKKYMPVVS